MANTVTGCATMNLEEREDWYDDLVDSDERVQRKYREITKIQSELRIFLNELEIPFEKQDLLIKWMTPKVGDYCVGVLRKAISVIAEDADSEQNEFKKALKLAQICVELEDKNER